MKIKSSQLDSLMQEKMSNLFLAYGSEVLLVNESIEKIKRYFKKLNPIEKVKFDVSSSFDWNKVFNEINETSLFSSHKLIIINLSGRGDKDMIQAKTLLHFD